MKSLAVFASGTGTNFVAIAKACAAGVIDARVALLVCDKPGAPVLDRARELGVDTFVFSAKDYASKADYEAEIVKRLDALKVDLVCLAGYMRIVGETLLQAYEGKIINIHPSLLPAFRGAHAVEQAVAYGVKVYGITIHWVNSDLDGGKIIAQRAFPYEGSDPAEVHAIGQKIEHELYVETINKVLCER
ncbi:MAG: phosphoribosylglycinamide formyltransferase [Bacteroidales bacterium]|jgi:phosphoribosylglycinamide formyltransferase-1|nr:phosphoribosylglycinamide formyltransferase [Bacteroidales bacterium]